MPLQTSGHHGIRLLTADVEVKGVPQGVLIHNSDLPILLKPGFPTTTEEIGIELLVKIVPKISDIMLTNGFLPGGQNGSPLPISPQKKWFAPGESPAMVAKVPGKLVQ